MASCSVHVGIKTMAGGTQPLPEPQGVLGPDVEERAWAAVKEACVAAQTKVSTETAAAKRDFDRGAITDEQRKHRCKIAWDLYEQEARAAFKDVIPTPDTDGRQEMDLAFDNVKKAKAEAKEAERRVKRDGRIDAGVALELALTIPEEASSSAAKELAKERFDLAKEVEDEAAKQESAANAALAEADAKLNQAINAFFAYHQWRFLINKL